MNHRKELCLLLKNFNKELFNKVYLQALSISSCSYKTCTMCGKQKHTSLSSRLSSVRLKSRYSKSDSSSDTIVINPLENLQKYVDVPIVKESNYVFKPTMEDIIKAQKLFIPAHGNEITFLKSALYDDHLPQYDLPEVAFIGRSNVGKSSLIKMILQEADDEVKVRCSKTPGHTKLMNFFQVGQNFTLVDMPGYGYRMPEHYVSSVENFLHSRKKLGTVLILLDGVTGLNDTDIVGLNMLQEFGVPYTIVLTKIDKGSASKVLQQLMKVQKYMKANLTHCLPQPFLVSSTRGDGIALLQAFIAYVTGHLCVSTL